MNDATDQQTTTANPDKEFMRQKGIAFHSHVDFHDVYANNDFPIINVIDHDYDRNIVVYDLTEQAKHIVTGQTVFSIEVSQSTRDKYSYDIACSANIDKLLQMISSIRTITFVVGVGTVQLNPYLSLFCSCFANVRYRERFMNKLIYSYQEGHAYMEINQALQQMLELSKTSKFERDLKTFNDYIDYNLNKERKQLNVLYSKFDELEVVRLELFYRPGVVELDPTTAIAHRKLFVQYVGKMYRNIQGFMVKTEYTVEKGFHHHVALFLTPNGVANNLSIGHCIGAYWSDEITHKRGAYFNGAQAPESLRTKPCGLVQTKNQTAIDDIEVLVDWFNKLDKYYRPIDPTTDTVWHWNRFNI